MALSQKGSSTPLPERSLNRQVVLEEDEYTEALSRIIARDFFPSLVHLDATNEYLDALHSRDPHLISASVRRLEEISSTPTPYSTRRAPYDSPAQTPYRSGPSQTPSFLSHGESHRKRARYDTDLTLDDFQARYTSEDNSSFTQILDDENRKRKEKWGWAWEAQKRVEEQRGKTIEARERMLIEPASLTGVKEKFTIEAPTPAGMITDGKGEAEAQGEVLHKEEESSTETKERDSTQGKVLALTQPSNAEEDDQVDVMAPKKDTRSAGVDGWKFKARNSLMFLPDADESPYHSSHTNLSKTDPKIVKYGNTRLREQDQGAGHSRGASEPPSPTRSRIDAAITGTPYRPRSPKQSGFSLVPNVPSPTPSQLGPVAMKQLMTWGTLNATPRIISQTDDVADLPPPTTPFHLPNISAREAISHKLSNKASKSLRAKANLLGLGSVPQTPGTARKTSGGGKKSSMAPPSWTPRRSEAAGNLTPAARRLLERSTLGTAAAKRAEAMEYSSRWGGNRAERGREINHARWTPTPSPTSRR